MNHVLVRYGEIGTKSSPVRERMINVLRQRVVDRLEYENIDYERVSAQSGRIIAETETAKQAAEKVAELPGVSSASPAVKAGAGIGSVKKAVEELEIGESFAVRTNRAGEHGFSSQEVNREVGSYIEEITGSKVDLDRPETELEIDIRFDDAYVFNQRFEGPDGFPVGTEDQLLALVSGGIDSPVAAYQVMARGADILPLYFYNRPIAAEDHLLRFQSVIKKLEKFHPAKKWSYYMVEMGEVNRELLEVGRGRMLLHRRLMFRIAGHIAEKEGIPGIVTGESLGQKSSQTPVNLELSSRAAEKPVHRPLLGWSKNRITEEARKIGTFEHAEVDSACRSLAPENPATSMKRQELERLEEEIGFEKLVEKAKSGIEKKEL